MAELSNREKAAKKSGGTLNYKTGKVSVAPKVTAKPKAVSPLMGAGPLLPGQTRAANSYGGGSQLQGAGPLLPGQTRAKDSYSGGGSSNTAANRRKAAAAANIKNTGLDFQSAVDSGGLELNQMSRPVSQRPATLNQGGSTFMGNLKNKAIGGIMNVLGNGFESYSGAARLGSQRAADENTGRNMANLAYDNTLVVPGVNASNIMDLPGSNDQYEQDLASVFGPKQSQPDFGSALASGGITEGPIDNGRSRLAELFAPSANAQEDPYGGNRSNGNTDFSNSGNDNGGIDPTLQEEMQMQQNELYGGGQMSDTPGGTVGNRSGRGSGMFGTGKGIQSDDPYIKELRKAYSSNGGEKWLRKQFDELIKSLDPTYAQMQKEGTDALNAQLNNQNVQLASVMNANNTGDSEQRAQLMAGQQRDSQTALGNLLAKLAQSKAGDVSQYKQQYAQQRGQLEERNQSNAQSLLEKMRAYQNDQYDQKYKNASLAGRGGTTKAGSLSYLGDDANGNPVYYNTTTGQRTTEAGLKRKQSNPLEEAMAALLGQGQQGSGQVQYDENGRPYIEQ